MNEKPIRMLLYSDGSKPGSQALRLGVRIATVMASSVDILAIGGTTYQQSTAAQEVEAAVEKLRAADVPVTVHHRPGAMLEKLLNQAEIVDYDLIVIGSRGRRGIRRLVAGSRACSILKGTTTSVLVVKGSQREDIDQLLVGSAAGPESEETVRFAARLARALDTSVTLLHVMSQIALEEHAKAADLEAEAEELMEREAREGVHLENMLEILHDSGVEGKAIVRHGLIVDEIVAESRRGRFDMIVIGAHVAPGVEGFLSSDLSEQIMLSAERPILIVHQVQEA